MDQLRNEQREWVKDKGFTAESTTKKNQGGS